MVLRSITAICLALCMSLAQAKEQYTLKFATLLPTGTSWTNILYDWIEEVEQKSGGRIEIKLYAGGVMGDEPDVLRKMRKGQLHGALFTGYGIGRIYSPARVLEVPFLFQDTDESDIVRDELMPEIERGFKDNGFTLLGWPEVGFVHFFSKNRIDNLDDVYKRRIWLWQGDPLGEAFFKASDISSVPLSIIDVYTQLAAQHGSIDTVYISPFGAIAMQWHTKLKYGTEVPFTNAIGGLVLTNRFHDRLPADLQKMLKTTGKIASDRIRERAREENQRSIALLEQSGIEFLWTHETMEKEMDRMIDIRDRAAKHLDDTGYIPGELFSRVDRMLAGIRSKVDDAPKQGAVTEREGRP